METLGDSSTGLLDETGTGEDDEPFVNEDLLQLHRMWRNEKYAPEVLPFNPRVVQNISEVLEYVGEKLDEERADDDQDPNDPSCTLCSVDLERVKYVLRDYLRIRLWKLSQWPQHYLESANSKLLSDAERIFLRDYWHNKKMFFESRVLGVLPPSKRGLDDKIDLMDMVRRPCLEKYVYARINEDLGEVLIPSVTQGSSAGATGPERETLDKGKTFLLRYDVIRVFLVDPEHAGENNFYPKVDLV